MGRIVLFYSFILFVAITSTLYESDYYVVSVNSTHQELSCGHQYGIWINVVYRVDEAYCGKDTSTCSWRNTTTFQESCSIDSLAQLIYKCNGNNNCCGAYSILDDNMCCNGTTREPTCRNSKHFNIFYYCFPDFEILDLDTDKETSKESWLFIRASKIYDNLCECSVRSIPYNSFRYYYCDTSMHSRSCTSRQSSSKQRNFSFYPNKFTSLLLDTTYWETGGTLKVNCSCSANDQKITSTLNPLTTSNVETPICEKEKTGGSIMVAFIASVVCNVLQIIVTTVLVVYLCKKRRSSVNYSSATVSSPTDNEQYVNFRRNDVLYDDCDVAPPGNDNSNVPEETATYHYIVT